MVGHGYSRGTIATRVKQVDSLQERPPPAGKTGRFPPVEPPGNASTRKQEPHRHEGLRMKRVPPAAASTGIKRPTNSPDIILKITEASSCTPDDQPLIRREEEVKLCTALCYAVSKNHADKQADLLLQLGDLHLDAAVSQRLHASFPRAAACYTSAMLRSPSQQQARVLQDKLSEVESMASKFGIRLRTAAGSARRLSPAISKTPLIKPVMPSILSSTGRMVAMLFLSLVDEMRNDAQTKIDECKGKWMQVMSSVEKEDASECEREFMVSVTALRNHINVAMRDLFNKLCSSAIEMLGKPPCKYAIVGFGAVASAGMTPFSDFEFGILIDSDEAQVRRYFRVFCYLLETKVTALGETPLEHSGIRLIYDAFNTSLESLPDLITPNGIKIDLSPTTQSISPFSLRRNCLFSNATQTLELIMMPKDLADVIVNEDLSKRSPTLALKLSTYNLLSGDASLFRAFDARVRTLMMTSTRQGEPRHLMVALTAAKYILKNCRIPQTCYLPDPPGVVQPCLLAGDITAFHQLLQTIRLCHHLPVTAPETLVAQLRTKLIVSADGRSNLLLASASTYLLHVCMEMHHGGQGLSRHADFSGPIHGGFFSTKRDIQAGLLNQSTEMGESILYHLVGFNAEDMLLRYYTVLYSLGDILQNCIQNVRYPLFVASRIAQHGYAPRAHFEYRQLRIDSAMSALSDEISYLEQSFVSPKPTTLCRLYLEAAMISVEMRQTHDATNFLNKAMEQKDGIEDPEVRFKVFLTTWLYFGDCYLVRGKLMKAYRFYTDALDMHTNMTTGVINHELPALAYGRLGVTCQRLGRFDDALQAFTRAVRYSTSNPIDESAGLLQLRVAETFLAKGDYKRSVTHLNQCLTIMQHLHGSRIWHPIFARIYSIASDIQTHSMRPEFAIHYQQCTSKLSTVHQCMTERHRLEEKANVSWEVVQQIRLVAQSSLDIGVCQEALDLYKLIRHKLSDIFKGSMDQLNLIDAAYHVAYCTYRAGDYKDSQDAMTDLSTMTQNQEKLIPPLFMYKIHELAGCIASARKEFEQADMFYQKANKILRQVHGKEVAHPHVFDILEKQALALRDAHQLEDSLKQMEACLDGRKQFYGEHHPITAYTHELLGHILLQSTGGSTNKIEQSADSRPDDEKIKAAAEPSPRDRAIAHFTKALSISRHVDSDGMTSLSTMRLETTLGAAFKETGNFVHAESLLQESCHHAQDLYNRGIASILELARAKIRLGDLYRDTEQAHLALELHREAHEAIKSLAVDSKYDLANAAYAMAKDFCLLSLYSDGSRMYTHAIHTLQAVLSTDQHHLQLAMWLEEHAAILCSLGKESEAARNYQISLEIKKRILGEDCLDDNGLSSLQQLAQIEENQGNLQRALLLRLQVLDNHKPSSDYQRIIDRVDAITKVSYTYSQLRIHDKSLKYWKQAYEILSVVQEPPDGIRQLTIQTLHHIGGCYTHLGQYDEAVEVYKESLHLLSEVTDAASDIQTATTLSHIGRVLCLSGNSDAAVIHLRSSVEILHQAGPKAKEQLSLALYHLALAYETLPDLDECKKIHTEALNIRMKLPGQQKDMQTARTIRGLGRVEYKLKEYWESVKHLGAAVTMMQHLLGSDVASVDLAHAYNELGTANANVGNFTDAIRDHKKSLHIFRQVYGHEAAHTNIAKIYMSLAWTHKMAGHLTKAVADATQAIAIMDQVLGDETAHPDVASMYGLIGDCHLRLDQMSEAHASYRKMSQLLLSVHNGDLLHSAVKDALKKVSFTKKALEKETGTKI